MSPSRERMYMTTSVETQQGAAVALSPHDESLTRSRPMTSDWRCAISKGRFAKEFTWTQYTLTYDQLRDLLSGHVQSSKKDGPCFAPCLLAGTERKAPAVKVIFALVYDCDGGESYEDIAVKVAALKVRAIQYSSFSHMTTKTFIATDKFVAWAKKAGKPERHTDDDGEHVLDYLQSNKKGHLVNAKVQRELEHPPDGVSIVVTHEAVHKARIVIPLAVPYVMAEQGFYTAREQAEHWSQVYHGIGDKMGINFDAACDTPEHMYYLPQHPVGMSEHAKSNEFDFPEFLDWRGYTLASSDDIQRKRAKTKAQQTTTLAAQPKRTPTKEMAAVSIKASGAIDPTTEANLKRYLGKYGKTFKLAAALETRGVAPSHGTQSGGALLIDCPFEPEHTSKSESRTRAVDPTDVRQSAQPSLLLVRRHSRSSSRAVSPGFLPGEVLRTRRNPIP